MTNGARRFVLNYHRCSKWLPVYVPLFSGVNALASIGEGGCCHGDALELADYFFAFVPDISHVVLFFVLG